MLSLPTAWIGASGVPELTLIELFVGNGIGVLFGGVMFLVYREREKQHKDEMKALIERTHKILDATVAATQEQTATVNRLAQVVDITAQIREMLRDGKTAGD